MATSATELQGRAAREIVHREEGVISWAYAALVATAAAPALIKLAGLVGLQIASVPGIALALIGIVSVFVLTANLTRRSVRRESTERA